VERRRPGGWPGGVPPPRREPQAGRLRASRRGRRRSVRRSETVVGELARRAAGAKIAGQWNGAATSRSTRASVTARRVSRAPAFRYPSSSTTSRQGFPKRRSSVATRGLRLRRSRRASCTRQTWLARKPSDCLLEVQDRREPPGRAQSAVHRCRLGIIHCGPAGSRRRDRLPGRTNLRARRKNPGHLRSRFLEHQGISAREMCPG
jgi:hypothetical protein